MRNRKHLGMRAAGNSDQPEYLKRHDGWINIGDYYRDYIGDNIGFVLGLFRDNGNKMETEPLAR